MSNQKNNTALGDDKHRNLGLRSLDSALSFIKKSHEGVSQTADTSLNRLLA